jgi:hypothetical protein
MKIKIGDTIRFNHASDFGLITVSGEVVGFGAEIRKRWPVEQAEAPDSMLLVRRIDLFGNILYYSVCEADVIKEGFDASNGKGEDKIDAPEGSGGFGQLDGSKKEV